MSSDDNNGSLFDRVKRNSSIRLSGPAPSAEPEVNKILQGDLADKNISWLLMAAQQVEATGALVIGSGACNVTVQFGLGKAVHAWSPFAAGDEVIMDLFTWRDGKVRFESGRQPDGVSVQESIEELVRRGEAFGEDLIFLQNNLISEASFLLRPPGRLGKGELEKRLVFGRAIDTRLQVEFYGSIYGTLNLKDVAERLSLKQSQWVSLAANLLRLGLLVGPDARSLQCIDYNYEPEQLSAPIVTPAPPEVRLKLGVPAEIIDVHSDAAEGILSLLQVPETKILSYTALRFFLEREFIRAYRFKTMLSLAVFCVSSFDSPELHMPCEAVAELAGAVDKIKRDIDVMGHFGDVAFAVLLPMVDAQQAGLFVDRVQAELPHMLPHLGKYKPCLHFGIASVPAQATDLKSLGHAAQKAMFEAAEKKLPKVLAV